MKIKKIKCGSEKFGSSRISFRAHKVVLASVSTPSGTILRMMTRIHNMKLFIPKNISSSKLMISFVDLVSNAESKVNKRYFEHFLKILSTTRFYNW